MRDGLFVEAGARRTEAWRNGTKGARRWCVRVVRWVMRASELLGVLAVVLAGCGGQHDPSVYGTWKVGVEGCDALHRAWALDELSALAYLGPDWTLAATGGADVVVYCVAFSDCAHGAGVYVHGLDTVRVDPACTSGEEAFKTVAGHELVHWATYRLARTTEHVCRTTSDTGCTGAYEYGVALMNPSLSPGAADGYEGPISGVADPVYMDARLYRAAFLVAHPGR